MVPGVPFTFGPLLDSAKASFPRLESAPRPVYVFDQTGSKTDTWHDRGLTEHGPYTAQVFTPNQPRICVVCQQSMKGQVEQFLHKFVHGIKLPRHRRLATGEGCPSGKRTTSKKASAENTRSRISTMSSSLRRAVPSIRTGRLVKERWKSLVRDRSGTWRLFR